MKRTIHIIFLALLVQTVPLVAQVSHGGEPLFSTNELFLKNSRDFFVEMPSFDREALIREDSVNSLSMRGSFRFATKFFTDIERGISGQNLTLPDGTKIWRVGIRSKGAYSINILFSEFHIPEGAKLFLYNSDQTHVIGSFTSENNSEGNILPVRPVRGDEIIVEYSEPANADFEGQLKVTEVNHEYINLRGEPGIDQSSNVNFKCMPDAFCQDPDNPNMNSTVLLIIDGIYYCSGSLINNTKEDGIPYILTAAHCINANFAEVNPSADFYIRIAGSIITFFDYQRPVCNARLAKSNMMKATEEMSIAGAIPRCIHDTIDLALLQLKETPPDYYRSYYAGWNINYNFNTNRQEQFPFENLHHPNGGIKKYGLVNNSLRLADFPGVVGGRSFKFYPKSHWEVSRWYEGATAGGSSGSPLFDNQGLIIGGLTGGSSLCNNTVPNNAPDYFFGLFKGWEWTLDPAQQLKTWLDPINSGVKQLNGLDIYRDNPLTRIINADYNGEDTLTSTALKAPASGFLFGHNSLQQATEFAEEFTIEGSGRITGAFLLCPPVSFVGISAVEIKVYDGNNHPETELSSVKFYPVYTSYNQYVDSAYEAIKSMNVYPTESFVKFDEEVPVGRKFYIAYKITYPSTRSFSVYNVALKPGKPSTAWIKNGENWIKSTDYTPQPIATSLAVHPLIKLSSETGIDPVKENAKQKANYDRSTRILSINAMPDENGIMELYSISGQVIKSVSFSGNAQIPVYEGNKNSVGIVRIITGSDVEICKIIF